MKILVSALIFLSLSTCATSQTSSNESGKIATFCKIWGFLKYYHPEVAKGVIDWDREFTSRLKTLKEVHSRQEISAFYSEWINGLGKIAGCKKCSMNTPDNLKYNLDLRWLYDSVQFTPELIGQLLFVLQNRNQKANHYVQMNFFHKNASFKNEKAYMDSVFPSPELRLLALARYWNIIQYFFPYKYKTDQNWNDVLTEMISKFKDVRDTVSYHLAMLELTAKINDSHAFFMTKYTDSYFGEKYVPFMFKIIDNKAIVTGFYNDSLCKLNDIQIGDAFLNINNTEVVEIIKEKSKYIGASNEASKLRDFDEVLFNGSTDSIAVSYERDHVFKNKFIQRYDFDDLKYTERAGYNTKAFSILEGNIGYVNMGLLMRKDVDLMMKELENTVAIIFDVRNYPNGTGCRILKHLNHDKRKAYLRFTSPDLTYPGVFHYLPEPEVPCGKDKNFAPYKGKVVLLFNEMTQSHAEFTLMILKSASNVIGIGSQTAGADGDVSLIVFPGGYETYMTGTGIFYPDGRETQRVGIIPDIEVKPTIEGIRSHKDEVLEKAIELISRK